MRPPAVTGTGQRGTPAHSPHPSGFARVGLMDDDDYDSRPVGFMGKMRGRIKGLTWVLILSLIAITVGATSLLFLFQ